MDYLKSLEAQSNFILREAYREIGHLPMPAIHLDTGKKFSERYDFRARHAKEWGLDIRVVDFPALEIGDPGLPRAARKSANP